MTPSLQPLPAARARLAAVLRAANGLITVGGAAQTLSVSRTASAKILSRWREQGWLRRVGPGRYVPVPLDLAMSEQVVDDPWVLVPSLFGTCYVGGWTAAHHWDLTEQLFNELLVFTTSRFQQQRVTVQGVVFGLHHTVQRRIFGVSQVWRGSTRVPVSDPARTIIDMLAMPQISGGIDHTTDCLIAFHRSASYDQLRLIDYGERFGNGAIFKRLGYLSETRLHDDALAVECRARLSQGYARLDPALACDKLVTAWRLWVPHRLLPLTA